MNCHLVDEIELATILDSVESNIKSSIVAVQGTHCHSPTYSLT
jgi:hypothetical protein